jgi:hypothetical protein
MSRLLQVVLALLVIAAPAAAQKKRPASKIPTPASVLGFEPGADRKLPEWKQVVEYFTKLDAASPRITVRTLGKTTLGRPFIAAFIGDSAAIKNLPKWREIQRRLADPRLRRKGERDSLVMNGKLIVLVTSSIHSDEVGGIITPLVLAHRLVTSDDADAKAIRASTIVILVPSLNPDGVDIVGDWYRATLGTPSEGSEPPVLYHHYTGHDNNRDWYAFTQVETQLTVDSLHNMWHPMIVNDIHQQGERGSRIFIPPYLDPFEPNIDPILLAGLDQLGLAMTWRLTAEGKTGIATYAIYDAWTPARAYSHYHGGVRLLTETASARLATPIDIPFDSLQPGRGYDARVATWNFLAPWPGGHWTLGNIVDYQTSATWALLASAAHSRAMWMESFARVSERAVEGQKAEGREKWPAAFIIPMQQPDQAPLRALLRILQRGGVEIRRATANFAADKVRYSAGTYVVLTDQPYGSFAKALLEDQNYPDMREYPGGPPRAPYDVTAHTLPLLMGVGVAAVDSFPIPMSEIIGPVAEPRLDVPGLSGSSARRIAIYRSYAPSIDEGWTRFLLDEYKIPYTVLVNRDIRAGGLRAKYDVIILPDQSPREIRDGAYYETYPDSLTGGLGDPGAAALKDFATAGGTIVAFNDASRWAITALVLPVRDVLAGVPSREFYGPGSLLRVNVDRAHPLTQMMTAHAVAWFEHGPAFETTDSTRTAVIARYPAEADPLLSGWLLGGDRLRGKAALVDVRQGTGHVLLFGFKPQFRGQSMAMYPLIWMALKGW